MNHEINPHPGASQEPDEISKYGVPVTFRLSAHMKKILGDEAALRGISLAQYGADLLLTAHKNSADKTAEMNMLIRERDLLKQQVTNLTDKLQEKEVVVPPLAAIYKNRGILQCFAANGTITKAVLEKEGFDFGYMTHAAVINDMQFYCVVDIAYAVDKDLITIKAI